ncbi:TVP38/TMEM64 family protein [Jeotgalicoccus coquinae]|uniref:TVP38/TMEM64 family membrane protein n=1 Tax=Jeotgalicoccus coquinae TaxID=709509 RepID=A0A6V7RL58_9STAP|nr:VTT domain-containing protein [Jeotgalicoccus coquinae]MBB6422379.1 putative membrane protein YdjX (TVP38/TMEM64 family) [Jeotgalicoccus coquinae]GGE16262.1 TVP38/TMEM64 family protein [Jeotgalicoccus coquinae]CAD2078765.1 TVP38/TMEM64 family inner membrane protein YdjZ [Jeotgalicoccus coquinae]
MNEFIELLTTEQGIEALFQKFEDLGFIVGFLLVLLEAFLPFLPLVVIVILNINSYGIIVGFLVSYVAGVAGSYLVFLTVRNIFRVPAQKYIDKHEKLRSMLQFIDKRGFTFLFILLSLPFTPSSVVNVITALSNIRRDVYLYILLASKFIMILSMTLVGYDITSFFDSPVKLIISLVFLAVLYLLSKWYQKYLERKMNK